MTRTVLALTIALAVTGCTIYIGGDDDDDHDSPDAGWWPDPEGDAGNYPDADEYQPDGGYDSDAMPVGDAGVPDTDATCGTPVT